MIEDQRSENTAPIREVDDKTQREIADQGGPAVVHEQVGYDNNADKPNGQFGNKVGGRHTKPEPGEDEHAPGEYADDAQAPKRNEQDVKGKK
jgi:hypothetical protein